MTLETKERTALPWPDPPAGDDPQAAGQAARDALAAEWRAYFAANPQTPAAIERFYRQARGLGADLEAWHRTPERAEWTRMLVHVAQRAQARRIVDIGCGAGHDLLALREALPAAALAGVEPNDLLRRSIPAQAGIALFFALDGLGTVDLDAFVSAEGVTTRLGPAPIEQADLLICIDVLEHVPDPEAFLGGVAQRAPVGCLLFETTATHDAGTPLHLPAHRGWHPGRCLERHGWELADHTGRVRVWRRVAEAGRQRAGLLLCAYRNVTVASLASIMALTQTAGSDVGNHWRLKVKSGDALISRSRSVLLTAWWRETNDDVALLVDDDVTFGAADADHITELCRNGYPVICGAYPVRDGAHLALRYLDGTTEVRFGPQEPPVEVRYPATGFLAIHRRVVDALIAGRGVESSSPAPSPSPERIHQLEPLPLCHPRETWSHYNLFPTMVIEDGDNGPVILSEDWSFGELARRAGFRVYLDPTVRLQHAATVPISLSNMAAIHSAIAQA